MKITTTSSSLHRSKSFSGRCALEENCISQRHFWLWDSYFPQGALLTEPYSCNFMLTRQVLLTKVIHVLNQVQNRTAFIHYFYKAITNDSLACDLFRKNYEPFTSLLLTSGSFALWFIVIFLEGLVPQVHDQILLFVLSVCVWGLPSPSCVSDDPGKWRAEPLSASDLPECWAQHEKSRAEDTRGWVWTHVTSFPCQAKGSAAPWRNCRTRVSAGRCHQCQQNYTPRELKPFKSGRYLKDYFKKVSKGKITRNALNSLFPRSQENLNSRKGLFPLWVKTSWQRRWIPGRESRQILVLFCLNSIHAPRNCFISGLPAMELDQMHFLREPSRKCETMACLMLQQKLKPSSC